MFYCALVSKLNLTLHASVIEAEEVHVWMSLMPVLNVVEYINNALVSVVSCIVQNLPLL